MEENGGQPVASLTVASAAVIAYDVASQVETAVHKLILPEVLKSQDSRQAITN